MASLDWIAKTVDTAGRPCPLRLGESCPGTRRQCAWWLDEIIEKATTAKETAAQGGCGVMWLYAIQHEVRDESIRTQANIQNAATAVRNAGAAVVASMMLRGGDGPRAVGPNGDAPKQLDARGEHDG